MSRFVCEDARSCLVAEANGTLSDESRTALTAHLSVCAACAEEGALMATAAIVARTGELSPPPPLVRQRQLAGRLPAASARAAFTPLAWTMGACFLLLVVGAGAAVGMWWPTDSTPQDDAAKISDLSPTLAAPGIALPPTPAQEPADNPASSDAGLAHQIREIAPIDPKDVLDALDADDIDAAARIALQLDVSREDGPTITALTRLAQAQRTAARYDEACLQYGRLVVAYPDSDAAANARVAVGQMKLTAMDRPEEAIESFAEYVDRQPFGTLAQDARLGIIRAEVLAGTPQRVIAATDEYLAFHQNANGTSEVLVARADALRVTGQCDRAQRVYSQVLDRETGTAYESVAREGLAACDVR